MMKRLVRAMPGYRALHLLLDLVRTPAQRQSALLRLRAQPGLFQPFGTTKPERYPNVFDALQTALGTESRSRILSFGCSTGEEVETLARRFPNAQVKGLDISPERIAVSRARASSSRTVFEVADSAAGEPDACYDAVLAMAVFRDPRFEHWSRARRRRGFAKFEETVGDLARTVKPGGYIALRHSNFRFTDVAAAADFEVVFCMRRRTPKFDRAGRRIPDEGGEDTIFRKR